MNKKNKRKEKYYSYRGIRVLINSAYTDFKRGYRGNHVMILFPDIEAYKKCNTGIRSSIDIFLKNYKKIDNGIPF